MRWAVESALAIVLAFAFFWLVAMCALRVDAVTLSGGGSSGGTMGTPSAFVYSNAVEALHATLGATTACSEPLDYSETISTDPFDFATSPDGSECGSFGIASPGSGNAAFVAATGDAALPAAARGEITNVLRYRMVASEPNDNPHLDGMGFTAGLNCHRFYFRYSSDFPLPNSFTDTKRVKVSEMSGLPNWQVQGQGDWGGAAPTWNVQINSCGAVEPNLANTATGDLVVWTECRDAWCRWEMCVDSDFGNPGNHLDVRARIVAVETGRTRSFAGTECAGANLTANRDWLISAFRQDPGDAGETYYAFAMQAHWTTDTGQWIGPACEMEGGC